MRLGERADELFLAHAANAAQLGDLERFIAELHDGHFFECLQIHRECGLESNSPRPSSDVRAPARSTIRRGSRSRENQCREPTRLLATAKIALSERPRRGEARGASASGAGHLSTPPNASARINSGETTELWCA